MTKLWPFFITVIFITERKPRNAQFSVPITWVDLECHFQFQKHVIVNIPVKTDQVTTLFNNCRFYNRKKDLLEESPEIMQIYKKNIRKPLKKFCKNLTQQVRVTVKKNAKICPDLKRSLMAIRQKSNSQQMTMPK